MMKRRQFALHVGLLVAAPGVLSACGDKTAVAAAPPAAKTSAPDAYALAAQGTGFTVGAPMAANTVYVFFDTTCPHCAHLWSESKPLLGRLKMVWMPVGLLRDSSAPQGATILAASDPAAAMAQNEALLMERKGGIPISATLPPELVAKVKVNTELFLKTGAESVPLIVFRNAKSGEHGLHAGAVDTAQLAAMVGV